MIPLKEKDGIVVVDLLAAASKVLYDSLIATEDKQQEKQGLLLPLTSELSLAEAHILKEHRAHRADRL